MRDLNGNCGILGTIVSFVGSILQGAVNIVVTIVGAVATGVGYAANAIATGAKAIGTAVAKAGTVIGGALYTAFQGGGDGKKAGMSKGGKGSDISGNKMYASNDEAQVWDDFFSDSPDQRQKEYFGEPYNGKLLEKEWRKESEGKISGGLGELNIPKNILALLGLSKVVKYDIEQEYGKFEMKMAAGLVTRNDAGKITDIIPLLPTVVGTQWKPLGNYTISNMKGGGINPSIGWGFWSIDLPVE